jgi:hypothetical protein
MQIHTVFSDTKATAARARREVMNIRSLYAKRHFKNNGLMQYPARLRGQYMLIDTLKPGCGRDNLPLHYFWKMVGFD